MSDITLDKNEELNEELKGLQQDLKRAEEVQEAINESKKPDSKLGKAGSLIKKLSKIPGSKAAITASLPAILTISLIGIFVIVGIVTFVVLERHRSQGLIKSIDLAIACEGNANIECLNELYKKSVENQESRVEPQELE